MRLRTFQIFDVGVVMTWARWTRSRKMISFVDCRFIIRTKFAGANIAFKMTSRGRNAIGATASKRFSRHLRPSRSSMITLKESA